MRRLMGLDAAQPTQDPLDDFIVPDDADTSRSIKPKGKRVKAAHETPGPASESDEEDAPLRQRFKQK